MSPTFSIPGIHCSGVVKGRKHVLNPFWQFIYRIAAVQIISGGSGLWIEVNMSFDDVAALVHIAYEFHRPKSRGVHIGVVAITGREEDIDHSHCSSRTHHVQQCAAAALDLAETPQLCFSA